MASLPPVRAIVPDPGLIIAVNYFGAVATLEGLRPMLARSRSPRAVLIISTAAMQADDMALADACLAGDELAALATAEGELESAYHSSKYAVGRWLRRAATSPERAGAGILLNGIGPGRVNTAMIASLLTSEEALADLSAATPLAIDRPYGEPEDDIAEVATFRLELKSNFLLGQILYVDGGTEAIWRPDRL